MHGTLSAAEIAATNAADRFADKSDISVIEDDEHWFTAAAQTLLAPKPGLTLHLQTDCGERNGHRYTSGEVKIPGYLLRKLLRSEQGAQWLAVVMDGARPQWWLDHKRAERITAQIDNLDLE